MDHGPLSREHHDPYAGGQPALAVDRRRIIHSSAFRRLQYKTQVFVSRTGDHFRSRMTHTLEVASLARRIADELGLSADLAEVVALAHDLGHPPFGHAGERALHACMEALGERFEHNEQTLRVVTYLEHPYPEFRGLNLTAAVRACLRTHSTRYDRPETADHEPAPLEGQVVAQADQLAYALHDLQDGLYAGLIEPEMLAAAELWGEAYRGPATPIRAECLRYLRPTVERIQAMVISDLRESFKQIDSGSETDGAGVVLSEQIQARLDALVDLLAKRVYKHADVSRMDDQAAGIVSNVFNALIENPRLMPERYSRRVSEDGAARVVADYVAGMTDRFCTDEHARICVAGS